MALIGSNGAGKSTLMKLMVGLLKPSEGEIFLNGDSIHRKRTEDLSRQISLVYQNPEQMFIQDSIRADVSFAMKARGVKDYQRRTRQLLERFRLEDLAERDGRLLSGGQMRRASLAIGVALDPGILLLDEPTANLDLRHPPGDYEDPGGHEGNHRHGDDRHPRHAAGMSVGPAHCSAEKRPGGGRRHPGSDF